MEKNKQRLSKVMAAAGVASRRACEELIFDGRVTVDGEVVLLPQTMVDLEHADIAVDGKKIGRKESKVYYVLNKPRGYICSNRRGSEKTKIILDLFEGVKERIFTVGRLDKDTEGLLMVTNDGHFANRCIHPSSNIHKEYLAKTDHDLTHEHLVAISAGTLVEGLFIKPVNVQKVRRGTIKITVSEGKKHEVRSLLEAAGLQIKELTRIRIGGLHLGSLPLGKWRVMTENERRAVFE